MTSSSSSSSSSSETSGERTQVVIYCDGSCLGNPGPGGWAALLRATTGSGTHEKMLTGGMATTTNNQMELMAAAEALKALTRPCDVEVVTDSKYVIDGITTWIFNWKKNGWKAQGKPVKNADLWRDLDGARLPHLVKWTWVKGHAGHPENERVDAAARDVAGTFARR